MARTPEERLPSSVTEAGENPGVLRTPLTSAPPKAVLYLDQHRLKMEARGNRIEQLPQEVINRIAAGEVIVRPSHAVKELIENSLDAGARRIALTYEEGGLKWLQVADDGCGMRRDDLPILCHRFTTSKLRQVEDLQSLSTFGFRGEALASLSHVARLTVATAPHTETEVQDDVKEVSSAPFLVSVCSYLDGEVAGAIVRRPGAPGTTVSVQDLFYNMPIRRQALRPSEEQAGLIGVVQKYAVHNHHVAFSCRSRDEVGDADVFTEPNVRHVETLGSECVADVFLASTAGSDGALECGNDDKRDLTVGLQKWWKCKQDALIHVIRGFYGQRIVDRLVPFLCYKPGLFVAYGLVSLNEVSSSSIRNRKTKGNVMCFINHRLVEISSLRRCLEESVADSTGAKTDALWAYLALHIPADEVDVNVHPSKKEVIFLHQDAIFEEVRSCLRAVLLEKGDHQAFTTRQPITVERTSETQVSKLYAKAATEPNVSTVTEQKSIQCGHSFASQTSQDGNSKDIRSFSVPVAAHLQPGSRTSVVSKRQSNSYSESGRSKTPNFLRTRTDNHQAFLQHFFSRQVQNGAGRSKQRSETAKQTTGAREGPMASESSSFNSASQAEDSINSVDVLGSKAPEASWNPTVRSITSFHNLLLPSRQSNQLPVLRLIPSVHPLLTREGEPLEVFCEATAQLQKGFAKNGCQEVTKLMEHSTYVGVVDLDRVALQCQEQLVVVALRTLFEEAVFQSVIDRMGALPFIAFDPPVKLSSLLTEEEPPGEAVQCEGRDTREPGAATVLHGVRAVLFHRRSGRPSYKTLARFSSLLRSAFSVYIDVEVIHYPLSCGGRLALDGGSFERLPIVLWRVGNAEAWSTGRKGNLYRVTLSRYFPVTKADLRNFFTTLLNEVSEVWTADKEEGSLSRSQRFLSLLVVVGRCLAKAFAVLPELGAQERETEMTVHPVITELYTCVFHPCIALNGRWIVPLK